MNQTLKQDFIWTHFRLSRMLVVMLHNSLTVSSAEQSLVLSNELHQTSCQLNGSMLHAVFPVSVSLLVMSSMSFHITGIFVV